MDNETIYMTILIVMILHMLVVIANAAEVINIPWIIVLLPEEIIALIIVGGMSIVSAMLIYARVHDSLCARFGRRRCNGK